MRRAAVLAGLIKDTEAGNLRLSFVTEGEASLHFSIHNGLPSSAMEVNLFIYPTRNNRRLIFDFRTGRVSSS